MTRHVPNPKPRRPSGRPGASLPGAVLAVAAVLFAAPAAAEKERGMPAQASGTTVSAPAPAPAPVSAPSRAPAAPSSPPSYQPAPARSAPASSPPASSPSTASAPPRGSSGSGSASGAARVGGGGGYVSAPPRGSFHPKPYPPHRHYHPPAYWGTWYGNPYWGWGWGPYWGWGWGWGWGGVVVVQDDGPSAGWYARVDTDVSPETAEVYLDGTYIGTADDFDGFPDYLYLEPGRYRIEFRHPAYETVSKEVEAREGRSFRFEDDMKLLPGKRRIDAVDPEDRGTPLGRVFGKPESAGGAPAGRHQVRAEPDEVDEPEEVEDVVEAPAPPEPEEEALPAERARLRFEVEPGDAAVYLDDRYVGTGEELAGLSRGLAVSPGRHTVTVVRPGRAARTIEVEAKPGRAIDVVVTLEK